MSGRWTKRQAGEYATYYAANNGPAQLLDVMRRDVAAGSGWIAKRDGGLVPNGDSAFFPTMKAAQAEALEAARRADAWDGEPEPVEAETLCAAVDRVDALADSGLDESPEYAEALAALETARAAVRVSRQVRRAEARAARKAATRPGPFDGGRAKPGRARSISAASAGEKLEPVPWSTPVKPLTGAAAHCVWSGTTPPEQIRAASYAYWRQAGQPAFSALESMREDCAAGNVRFPRFYSEANPNGDFAAYGESRMRWIENPEAFGLRLVGLAHECGEAGHAYSRDAVDHTGWYLDSDGFETVAGVVYRLPGRDGRARYLAGYADPWNGGAACLSLDIIDGPRRDSDWEADSALREAACAADGIAERMAEETREHESAYRAGAEARGLAADALGAGRTMVAACRELRKAIATRRGSPAFPAPFAREAVREAVRDFREARRAYLKYRRDARSARDDKPGRYDSNALGGWRSGYAEGI